MSAISDTELWGVSHGGLFPMVSLFKINIGVRPVIVINKNNVVIKKIISFTIDGVTLQAEEGMTWGEWVNSKYSSESYYVEENLVINKVGLIVENVSATDLIESNGSYKSDFDAGGSGE